MLNVYSKSKDGNTKLAKNFTVKEFACKDWSNPIFINSELVDVLQKIRDHFGEPVTITSAYRTVARNNAIKGGEILTTPIRQRRRYKSAGNGSQDGLRVC